MFLTHYLDSGNISVANDPPIDSTTVEEIWISEKLAFNGVSGSNLSQSSKSLESLDANLVDKGLADQTQNFIEELTNLRSTSNNLHLTSLESTNDVMIDEGQDLITLGLKPAPVIQKGIKTCDFENEIQKGDNKVPRLFQKGSNHNDFLDTNPSHTKQENISSISLVRTMKRMLRRALSATKSTIDNDKQLIEPELYQPVRIKSQEIIDILIKPGTLSVKPKILAPHNSPTDSLENEESRSSKTFTKSITPLTEENLKVFEKQRENQPLPVETMLALSKKLLPSETTEKALSGGK